MPPPHNCSVRPNERDFPTPKKGTHLPGGPLKEGNCFVASKMCRKNQSVCCTGKSELE